MKRYTSAPNQNLRNLLVRYLGMEDAGIEDTNGEWVKYEDVKTDRDEIVAHYEKRIDRLYGLSQYPDTSCQCNCYEYSQVDMGISCAGMGWVCPAHGYKERLNFNTKAKLL